MRILSHLRELSESLEDWRRYQSISIEELRTDRDRRNMVLHALLISIQSAIDIATYVIAEKGLRRPSTYRETFEILGEERIISEDLANDLSDMAGFRNVLVHTYWELDLDVIYGILQNDLKVLIEFKKIVKELLEEM